MMESQAKRLALEQLYRDNFKPEVYLSTYYRTLDVEVEFFLGNLHHFFFVSNGKLMTLRSRSIGRKLILLKRNAARESLSHLFLFSVRRLFHTHDRLNVVHHITLIDFYALAAIYTHICFFTGRQSNGTK